MKKAIPKTEYKERAVYTGRRLGQDGKVRQRFELLPSKQEMFFTGIKRVYIGYTYKCHSDSISVKPEMTTDPLVNNPEWDAKDALVDKYNEEKRAEAKIRNASKPALKAVIEALYPLTKNLSFSDRRKLIELLIEKCIDEDVKSGKSKVIKKGWA